MCFVFQWLRRKAVSVLHPEGTTPMKWGIVAALYFSMFGYSVTVQMLFAFLPDMVKSFGISDEETGYYVGLLASSVYLGRFLSSYFWGWLSDKIGRRKVLLWCLGLLAVTSMSFGFAKSFATAFVIRFLTGLVAGIPGTVKAALTETCDKTNQALGMSLIIAAWNSGLIIGPAVGGYLAKPVSKYPLFKKGSFFDDFAYLLPCLFNITILLIGFLLVFFVFPETLAFLKKKNEEDIPMSVIDGESILQATTDNSSLNRRTRSKNSQCGTDLTTKNYAKQNGEASMEINEPFHNRQNMISSGSVTFLHDVDSHDLLYETTPSTYVLPNDQPKSWIFSKAFVSFKSSKLIVLCRDSHVRSTVALYSVFSFAVIAEHEIYSVWAASGKNLGGLDFDTNDLGFTLMLVGIGTVLSSCIVYPQLVKVFGDMKAQFLTLYVAMFFTIILPGMNIFYYRNVVLKAAIICVLLAVRIAQGCCFTGQFIFIGNSVPSDYRATAHGLSITVMCLARAISPIISGSLFSWSVSSGLGFPFNEKCVYIFIGSVFWLSLVVACCLDPEVVTKRKD